MREWWRNILLDYFTFPSGQRNGILILCVAILFCVVTPSIYSIYKKNPEEDFTLFKRQIDSFQQLMAKNGSEKNIPDYSLADLNMDKKVRPDDEEPVSLFEFDPNTVSMNDLKTLGLKDHLIKTILSYRNKGGKFTRKEDLLKIYGLGKEDFDRLSPYIKITNDEVPEKKPEYRFAGAAPPRLVNLNSADSAELASLPGIGETLSERIIKFRNRLGGFYSTDQLNEVYGITPETFDKIKGKVDINITDIVQMDLNEVTLEELKSHPYFRSIASVVLSYRDQHGSFQSLDDLKNIDIISDEMFSKLAPYLKL